MKTIYNRLPAQAISALAFIFSIFISFSASSAQDIIIDNGDPGTSYTGGTWSVSSAPDPYGTESLWNRNGATYTWHADLSQSGMYEVYMWWTEWSSRSTNAPVTISHGNGSDVVYVNQRDNGGQWNSLGQFEFNASSGGTVMLSAPNPSPTSYCADAVRFVYMSGQNIPPVAFIDSISPNPADSGESVTFVGHGTDSDGTVVAYKWSSGIDGFLSDSASFSTSLLSDGSHEITFEVQDDGGLWSEPVSETLIVGQVQAEIVIDNGDPGTSYTGGTWSVSSAPDPYGTESLYNRNGATYTWHADFPQSGMYEVYMWWTEWGSRSTNAPVTISHGNGSDVVYVNQRDNGGQWNSLGQFEFNASSGGTVMLSAPNPSPTSYCADAVRFVYMSGQNIPPVAFIDSISPNPADSGESVTFVGHGTDSDGTVVAYKWSSGIDGFLSDSASFSTSLLSDGSHEITFEVQDDGGLWSEPVSETLIIGQAEIVPVAFIDSISPNPADSGESVTFVGHGTDSDGTVVAYKWSSGIDGFLSDSASFSTSLLSDGSHEITFEVQDDGGLWSEPVSETLIVGQVQAEIVIDNGDPGTSSTGGTWSVSSAPDPYGTESLWNRNGATYTWHADFPQSGMYEVYMWWTEWSSRSTNAPVTISHGNGSDVVYVNQRDNGGQWNSLGQFEFNASSGGTVMLSAPNPSPTSYCADAVRFVYMSGQNIPPVAFIDSISPNPADSGESVTFVGHGTDSDGTVVAYKWSSGIDGFLSDSASFSTSLLSDGSHEITFEVQDDGGLWSEPVSETLIIGQAEIVPVAFIDSISPNPADSGESVTFVGHGTDSDGTVVAYKWSSGIDGFLSDSASFSTSLLSDGSHEITFEVQDDGGLWSEPVSETLIVGQVQAEIVIDNGDPGTSSTGGTWSVSSAPDPYGTESLWNRNGATYTWHADLSQSGMYEVYMWWTEWSSRSTNAPVKIYHNNGIEVVYVNQRENGGQWNLIGQFKFNPLDGGKLMLSAPDPSPISYCADAVKFVYVPCETRPCVSIMEPWDYYLQSSTDLYVQARVYEEQGGQTGLGVKFTLDGGQEIIDYDPPFETIFVNVGLSEHVVDAFLVDGNGDPVSGSSTHDQVVNVGVGNYYVAIGDSITLGYGDDNTLDDISSDGRNYGGGFEPLLNDFLTDNTAVPHDIINEGVSRADSSDGLAVIDGLLQKHTEAQRFLVQYGTNDAWPILPVPSGKGLEPGNPGYPGTFKDNMQQIIQAINNDEKEVCLAKPPIALGDSADDEPYEDPDNGQRSLLIKEYNEVIDELVSDSSNQIDIIPPDFYGYFNYYDPQAGTYRYEIEYFDNLHPNGQGYRSMAEQWFEALTQ